VLEACVKSCGQKYHQEIGKFRFLNELIKLLSNKYDGPRTSQPVKHKIIELFYSWSVGLPSEPKIQEAYLMLKRQGVVVVDPHLPSQIEQYKPTPQPRMAVFEDDEKSKLLARLLASKHPDDLQAANRLIKNMVRQDEIREEKLSLRVQELEMVQNNTKLLKEMLSHYSSGTPNSDVELMKELYDSCEKLRTDLFKLAGTATEEGDDSLSEILRANDDLTKVIEDYRRVMGVPGEPRSTVPPPTSSTTQSAPDVVNSSEPSSNISSLIDLDIGSSIPSSGNGDMLSNDLQDL
ncbi:ADP-ribosylation factor-binding GGA1 isoform X1, partial [Paramuricea clavata]